VCEIIANYETGKKKRPLIEGPICLGSLWLGEVFASAI
jgi:hypothetical protein